MELSQIRRFVAVVQAGSFTKGAELAAISQPALSASIARLEAELEVKLLDRHPTRVTPTAHGYKLLAIATDILRDCNELKNDLKRVALPSILRVGVLQAIGTQRFVPFLRLYASLNESIVMELIDGSREELQRALIDHQVDAVISPMDNRFHRCSCQPLFTERFCLVVPKDHPLSFSKSVAPQQLHNLRFVTPANCETSNSAMKALTMSGIRIRSVYETDQEDRILSLVEAGVGLAIMPRQPRNDRVKSVEIADFDFARTIGLRWIPKQSNTALSKFIDLAATFDWLTA